jgi:hypothetical protein
MQASGLRLKTLACVSDVPSSTDHVSRARTAVARTARPAGAVLATRLSSADSSSSGVGDAGRCGASALRCPLARWRAHLRLRGPGSRGSVAGLARDGGDRVGKIAILPKHLCRLHRAVPPVIITALHGGPGGGGGGGPNGLVGGGGPNGLGGGGGATPVPVHVMSAPLHTPFAQVLAGWGCVGVYTQLLW